MLAILSQQSCQGCCFEQVCDFQIQQLLPILMERGKAVCINVRIAMGEGGSGRS